MSTDAFFKKYNIATLPADINDDEDDDGEGELGGLDTDSNNYYQLLESIRDGEIQFGEVPETIRKHLQQAGAEQSSKSGFASHPKLNSPSFDGMPAKMTAAPNINSFASGQDARPVNRPTNSNQPSNSFTPSMRP